MISGFGHIDDRTAAPGRPEVEGDRRRLEVASRRHRDGQAIFRFDIGDEQLWTSVLRMHEPIATLDPAEVGTDPAYAARTATGTNRTTPLRGLWQHPPYLHDGSAADLLAVVNHYDQLFALNLTAAQKADLVEFLKSL